MIVTYFWMWYLAPRVQMMYAVFWAPFCRVSIPNFPLPLVVCCLGFPLYFASLALGGDCWGSLMYVYNGYLVAKEGIDINPNVILLYVIFSLNLCCMVYLLSWLILCSCYPQLSDMMLSRWVVISFMVILANVGLWLSYLCVLVVHHLLTFVWLWWQVPCALTLSSQPPPRRPYSQICLDQHVNMLRMHLCMPDQPLLGGWTILCIILFHGPACFFADNSVSNFGSPLSWTFFLSLIHI